ncbi:MAG TPA: apolipoprotein N-acyltransferase [Casimicrobiaceae bacterium]|nr:apolipoprotein N-acyltransferase [Casimicrobiaceae bacterium]
MGVTLRLVSASRWVRSAASFLLGAAAVLGFAPVGLSPLAVLAPAALMALWNRAESPRAAGLMGFAFGLGLFGAGASWVYVALSTFGGMPVPLAGLATLIFCAYLALFPAVTGWVCARLAPPASGARLTAAAACWALTEWLRSWLLSGFPWLSIGYALIDSPLAGYAPVGGVFLVGLAAALTAALLAYLASVPRSVGDSATLLAMGALAGIWIAGAGLRTIEWSQAVGEPVTVSLVQGNVRQEIKFDPQFRDQTLAIYADLVAQAKGRLTVLPESALPMFADEVPSDYVARLRAAALSRDGDVLLGLFFFEPRAAGESEDHYFNSVVSIGSATPQVYRKRHLVPFGETIPLKPLVGWFIRSVLHIPLEDQTAGPPGQAPFEVAGQRVAVNICYEDAFGSELAQEAPDSTLLVNVTNDAWYGRSLAAEQHEQIAAFRAVETARPMLRATNTGITSIIDHRGGEIARLPWFTRGVLEGEIAGRSGVTPYVRLGDASAVVAALALAAAALFVGRRSKARAKP